MPPSIIELNQQLILVSLVEQTFCVLDFAVWLLDKTILLYSLFLCVCVYMCVCVFLLFFCFLILSSRKHFW